MTSTDSTSTPPGQGTAGSTDVVTVLQNIVRQLSAIAGATGGTSVGGGGVSFANLPAAPALGQIAVVTNSSVNTWGGTADGAGSFQVLVWYNGSAWAVIGK